MADRIHQVVDRADAANAEPAHQHALLALHLRARQAEHDRERPDDEEQQRHEPQQRRLPFDAREQRADGQHDEDLGEAFELRIEALHRQHHHDRRVVGRGRRVRPLRVRAGVERIDGQCLGLDLGRCGGALLGRLVVDPAQRQAGREDREKTVAVAGECDAVSQRDEAERDELVGTERLAMVGAQIDDRAAHAEAEQPADRQPTADGPQHVDRPPAPAPIAQVVQRQQAQAEHDERERRAVVQAALAGQAEAQAVAVAGFVDLHLRGQHRVGRREDGAEQHGRAERQFEQPVADRGDGAYRRQHRDRRELHRDAPTSIRERQFELEAGREERDQHRDLGQPFDQVRVAQRVQLHQVEAGRADAPADRQVQHRRTQRQPRDERAAHRHRDQQHADHDAEEREGRRLSHARARAPCWVAGRSRPAAAPGTARGSRGTP